MTMKIFFLAKGSFFCFYVEKGPGAILRRKMTPGHFSTRVVILLYTGRKPIAIGHISDSRGPKSQPPGHISEKIESKVNSKKTQT